MFRVIAFFGLLLVASVSATNFRLCSKGQPYPLSVEINDCVEMPCDVVKGTDAVMTAHFIALKDNTKSLTAKVRATALGLTVPYALPEDLANVCTNLLDGATCPMDKGEDAKYVLRMPIDQVYPEISVKVEVSLVDDNKETHSCFIADIKVKKGSSS